MQVDSKDEPAVKRKNRVFMQLFFENPFTFKYERILVINAKEFLLNRTEEERN